MNRFTNDIDVLDFTIMLSWHTLIMNICTTLMSLGFIIYTTSPYMIFALIPVLMFTMWFQGKYMTLKRELVRLEAVS